MRSNSPQPTQSHSPCGIGSPCQDEPLGQSSKSSPDRRTTLIRSVAALLTLIPLTGLGIASQLTPNSSGLGTHQQLGLPPCSMRMLLGIRCPGCGMTTSWAYFARGSWQQSVETSLGGFLFALLALWIAFLGIRTLLTAKLPSGAIQQAVAITAAGIFVISFLQWIQRLLG